MSAAGQGPALLLGLDELPWDRRVGFVMFCLILQAAYVHGVVKALRPGLARVVASAPLIALNLCAPLLFHKRAELVSRTVTCFVVMWLASFKLLSLCGNRGPLSPSWTLPQVLVLYGLPVYPRRTTVPYKAGRLADSAGTWAKLSLSFVTHLVILGCITHYLVHYAPSAHVRHWLYAFGMSSFLSCILDAPSSLAVGMLGIELCPTVEAPYLCTSLSDFWAKRWNITTGALLRNTVYDPIAERSWVAHPNAPRSKPPVSMRALGVLATFLVSGLVHELILAYVSPNHVFGGWFWYFTLQGPLVLIEAVLKSWAAARRIQLPRLVANVLTCAVCMTMATWLFFPPAERDSPLAEYVAADITKTMQPLVGVVRGWLGV